MGIKQVIISTMIICHAFLGFSQKDTINNAISDTLEQEEVEIGIKLWDTAKVGIISIPGIYQEKNICLTDSSHCCYFSPCEGIITSNFGWRGRRMHNGVDIDLNTGDPVYAAFDGIIRQSGLHRGYGNYIIISHFNGLETLYGHLSKRVGVTYQPVKSGQLIGYGGNTGHSYGSHLHFETRFKGKALNPRLFIDFENKRIKRDSFELNSPTFNKPKTTTKVESVVSTESDEAKKERAEKRAKEKKENDKKIAEKKAKDKKDAAKKEAANKNKEIYHTIKSGDTLYGLALKYKTTVAAICKLNKMKENEILDLGRKLRIK